MTPACETANLLKSIEVWRPEADGLRLTRAFPGLTQREPLNADDDNPMAVAWKSRVPVVREAPCEYEQPACVLALPAFCGDTCQGVLALHLEAAADSQAAVEIWRRNERNELARNDGWYRGLDRFAAITACVKFPRRAGLPGKVWEDRFPRVMGALGSSPDFVRAAGAKADGLSTGLGIPFLRNSLDLESVLVLLSSSRTPLFKAVEVWSREPGASELKIVSADYGPYIDLAPVSRKHRRSLGEGIAGHVYRDLAPWLTTDLLGVEFPRGELFAEYGFTVGAGFPVFVGEQLVAAVSLLA